MTEDFSRRFAAARRQIIEKEYANLNPEQREAVLTTEGPLLLLAGAGSGKTTVLIHRVANILQFGRGADTRELPPDADETMLAAIEDAAAGRTDVTDDIRCLCAVDPAAPWQVLAITFTNKAADELKNRLEAKLGEIGRDVWALTFHGTCVRILRRCADRLGFPNSFTIYDQADSLSVMKRILRDMNMDDKVFPPKAMLAAAGRYKGSLVSPEEAVAAEERSGDIRRIRTAKIYAAYAKHLQDAGAMDFDDLIYYTVRLLQDEPDVLAYYQKKFRYVLIDEYQDTNHLQYLFAALMASGSRNICVVGDDDQSIYKFRGATIENILSFEKQYPDARVIRLEQNYARPATFSPRRTPSSQTTTSARAKRSGRRSPAATPSRSSRRGMRMTRPTLSRVPSPLRAGPCAISPCSTGRTRSRAASSLRSSAAPFRTAFSAARASLTAPRSRIFWHISA